MTRATFVAGDDGLLGEQPAQDPGGGQGGRLAGAGCASRASAPNMLRDANFCEGLCFSLILYLATAMLHGLYIQQGRGLLRSGAAAEGSAVDVLDFQLDRPAILVIGSEGAGAHSPATLYHVELQQYSISELA